MHINSFLSVRFWQTSHHIVPAVHVQRRMVMVIDLSSFLSCTFWPDNKVVWHDYPSLYKHLLVNGYHN